MDLAASSVCLTASPDEMSGLGAPARTASPIPDLATSTRLPGTILPSRVSSSSELRAMMTRSTVSPPVMRLVTSTVPAHTVETLCPVSFSN